jgi:hypothetical protein
MPGYDPYELNPAFDPDLLVEVSMKVKKGKRSDVAQWRAAAKKRAGKTVDTPRAIIDAVRRAKMDPRHAHLDSLMADDVQPIRPASPVEVLQLEDLSDEELMAIVEAEIPKEHRYSTDDISREGKRKRPRIKRKPKRG